MLLVSGDKVLSALDILSKNIVHQGVLYKASGLSGVVTDPNERRNGYGRQLVTAARALMATWNIDLGIFTCDPTLQHFYESCGWQVLIDAPLIGGTPDRPFPSNELGKITLAHFFSAKAQHHALDFHHSRINLYPGEIDKLW